MTTRLLLVDDHRIVREGLRMLLGDKVDIDIVGEAIDGREAVRLAADLSPDVVLMDVGMRGMNGIEATRQIVAARPDTKILALSMHNDGRFVGEMLRAGASGYLLKDCAAEEIAAAIRTVLGGQVYLSPAVSAGGAGAAGGHVPEGRRGGGSTSLLTAREREVLQLVAEGKTSAAIAELLGVSIKTIETHRKQIMDKLGIRSIAGLTKYALREGLTNLD
jgi:DNA-binding NarL/FixJ family response regulator